MSKTKLTIIALVFFPLMIPYWIAMLIFGIQSWANNAYKSIIEEIEEDL